MGKDLGISEDVLKANFMFGTDKVGDTMTVCYGLVRIRCEFFGVSPPDLSVIARARGADWLYSYFKTFYVDENRPFGVNNLTFKDVGMPHVLWELQGAVQRLAHVESEDGAHHTPTYADLEIITPGTQSEEGIRPNNTRFGQFYGLSRRTNQAETWQDRCLGTDVSLCFYDSCLHVEEGILARRSLESTDSTKVANCLPGAKIHPATSQNRLRHR